MNCDFQKFGELWYFCLSERKECVTESRKKSNQDGESCGSCIIQGLDYVPWLQLFVMLFNSQSDSELDGHKIIPQLLASLTEYIMSTVDFQESFIVLNFKETRVLLKNEPIGLNQLHPYLLFVGLLSVYLLSLQSICIILKYSFWTHNYFHLFHFKTNPKNKLLTSLNHLS